MIIRTVEMENFKMFKKFSMAGDSEFKRFTLVGGGNNVGKTSLLEGLILGCDPVSPSIHIFLKSLRGLTELPILPETIWYPLYYKNDPKNEISIHLNKNSLFIKSNIQEDLNSDLDIKQKQFIPLKSEGLWENETYGSTHYIFYSEEEKKLICAGSRFFTGWGKKGEKEENIGKIFPRFLVCFMEGNKKHLERIIRFLDDANIEAEKRTNVIDFINNLYPNNPQIKDIRFTYNRGIPSIRAEISEGYSHEIAYLGLGIYRLLETLLGMATRPAGSLILIDEFESGLHYSILPKVMEEFAKLAQKFNQQIIATTHSYECLQAVVKGLADNKNLQENFAYVRLARVRGEEGHISALSHDYERVKSMTNSDWELR